MLRYITSLLFLFSPAAAVLADSSDLTELYTLMESKTQNKQTRLDAVSAGAERAYVCKFCHGLDGNSKRDHIPNLAQQNPKYLLTQFELFANYERKDRVMSELAKNLSADDRINIALYYSDQKVKSRKSNNPELTAKGKQLFTSICINCHGQNGQGLEELPAIANQPGKYITRTLGKYKSQKLFRPDSPMQQIVKQLSTSDIDSLAAYLSVMNKKN